MLGYSKPPDIACMIEISCVRLITLCDERLALINSYRSQERKRRIHENYCYLHSTWSKFWKWLGCEEPTLRDAIQRYHVSNKYGFSQRERS